MAVKKRASLSDDNDSSSRGSDPSPQSATLSSAQLSSVRCRVQAALRLCRTCSSAASASASASASATLLRSAPHTHSPLSFICSAATYRTYIERTHTHAYTETRTRAEALHMCVSYQLQQHGLSHSLDSHTHTHTTHTPARCQTGSRARRLRARSLARSHARLCLCLCATVRRARWCGERRDAAKCWLCSRKIHSMPRRFVWLLSLNTRVLLLLSVFCFICCCCCLLPAVFLAAT